MARTPTPATSPIANCNSTILRPADCKQLGRLRGAGTRARWRSEPRSGSLITSRDRRTRARPVARDARIFRRQGRGSDMAIDLNVNGERHSVDVAPETPLLWVIREQLQLTGTKFSC